MFNISKSWTNSGASTSQELLSELKIGNVLTQQMLNTPRHKSIPLSVQWNQGAPPAGNAVERNVQAEKRQ